MRGFVAILAIALFGMLAIAGLQAALADGGHETTVVNESWTPDPGNITELNDSKQTYARYNDSVTVRNESHVEMSEGPDYEWFESNGTIEAHKSGDLNNSSTAFIDYSYHRPTDEQIRLTETAALLPQSLGMMLPLFGFLLLLLIVRGGA